MKKIKCDLCQQNTEMYTNSHKNLPFIDGRNYAKLCFSCFNSPKTISQKYDKNGNIKEEIELEYSCENLLTAKELHSQGSSDTLKQAKTSLEAVCKSCEKRIKNKAISKSIKKIKDPNWFILS
jgi:hypothetical protein